MIVVISILSLLVMLVQVNLFSVLRRRTFDAQAQEFVSAMQMIASAAAESSNRYEVIVDILQQTYLVRQISGSDLVNVLDEEIIMQGPFGDHCRVSSVEFDDGQFTNDGQAKFRAGHAGWHYGGKIVFLDDDEKSHAVVVSRLNPMVELVDGNPEILRPKARDEEPFR